MVNKELLDYIKSIREKGYQDSAIKAHLLKYNYTQEAIDEAFKELLLPTQSPALVQETPKSASNNVVLKETPKETSKEIPKDTPKITLVEKKKKSTLSAILIVILILVVLGGAAFAVMLLVPKESFNLSFGSSGCENTTIDLHKIKGEPVVCIFSDNSKVQMILINNGNTMLNKIDLTVTGSKGKVSDKLDNLNLEPGNVFTRTIDYDYTKAGDAKGITILPYAGSGIPSACNAKKVSYDKIGVC